VGDYLLTVGLPPQPAAPRPGVFTTHREGPLGRDLYCECSVDSTLLEPGGVVRGAVSLTNVSEARGRSLRVSLVQMETQRPDGTSPVSWEVGRYTYNITGTTTEGEPEPFDLVLPRDLALTFTSARISARWFLEVGLHGLFADQALMSIPVTLLPPGSLPQGSRVQAERVVSRCGAPPRAATGSTTTTRATPW
jgi:hypothetical protein